ncbi:hypothetical protein MEZE111188_06465 [Mesobacillus zeae]
MGFFQSNSEEIRKGLLEPFRVNLIQHAFYCLLRLHFNPGGKLHRLFESALFELRKHKRQNDCFFL